MLKHFYDNLGAAGNRSFHDRAVDRVDSQFDRPGIPDLAFSVIPWQCNRENRYKTLDGRFHDFNALRHTHGTALDTANAPPRDQMRLERHSDPRLTMRYCHPDLVDQARSLGKLPSLPIPTAGEKQETIA